MDQSQTYRKYAEVKVLEDEVAGPLHPAFYECPLLMGLFEDLRLSAEQEVTATVLLQNDSLVDYMRYVNAECGILAQKLLRSNLQARQMYITNIAGLREARKRYFESFKPQELEFRQKPSKQNQKRLHVAHTEAAEVLSRDMDEWNATWKMYTGTDASVTRENIKDMIAKYQHEIDRRTNLICLIGDYISRALLISCPGCKSPEPKMMFYHFKDTKTAIRDKMRRNEDEGDMFMGYRPTARRPSAKKWSSAQTSDHDGEDADASEAETHSDGEGQTKAI